MSVEEQEVLKTLKNGFGLTSAEREILANYIDKLELENKALTIRLKHLFKSNIIRSYDEVDIINKNYKKDILTLDNDYISKDLIRNKIKELEEEGTKQYWTEEISDFLNELLEEN